MMGAGVTVVEVGMVQSSALVRRRKKEICVKLQLCDQRVGTVGFVIMAVHERHHTTLLHACNRRSIILGK